MTKANKKLRRSMKARRDSACCVCGGWVKHGERIAKLSTGWGHAECVLRRESSRVNWSEVYSVPDEAKRAHATSAALAYLRSNGTRVLARPPAVLASVSGR